MTLTDCERCGGSGAIQECIGVHYVTADMAMDACEPSMEGMPIEEFGWVSCPDCAKAEPKP